MSDCLKKEGMEILFFALEFQRPFRLFCLIGKTCVTQELAKLQSPV